MVTCAATIALLVGVSFSTATASASPENQEAGDSVVSAVAKKLAVAALKSMARQGWNSFATSACQDPTFREKNVDSVLRGFVSTTNDQRSLLKWAHVIVLQCSPAIDESTTLAVARPSNRRSPETSSPPAPSTVLQGAPDVSIDRNAPLYLVFSSAEAAARGDVQTVLAQLALLNAMEKPTRGELVRSSKANEEGLALFRSGAIESAAERFHAAFNLDPGNEEALNNWAFMMIQSGRYDEAGWMLVRTLSMSPYRASAWFNMAQIAAEQAKYQNIALGCILIADRFTKSRPTLHSSIERIASDEKASNSRRAAATKALDVIDGRISLAH